MFNLPQKSITARSIPRGAHICSIFGDETERLQQLESFFQAGKVMNERLLCLIESDTAPAIVEGLARLGQELKVGGQPIGYFPQGSFSSAFRLGLIHNFYQQALAEGFAGVRVAVETAWALQEPDGERRLVEHEAQVSTLLRVLPSTVLSQYDARRFSPAGIVTALTTHPYLWIRGQLVENPGYVPAEEVARHTRNPIPS
jgi:hypothetical protein